MNKKIEHLEEECPANTEAKEFKNSTARRTMSSGTEAKEFKKSTSQRKMSSAGRNQKLRWSNQSNSDAYKVETYNKNIKRIKECKYIALQTKKEAKRTWYNFTDVCIHPSHEQPEMDAYIGNVNCGQATC